jgi:hypothetical protein
MTIYDIIQFAWLSLLTVYALLNRELIKNLIVKNNERSHNNDYLQGAKAHIKTSDSRKRCIKRKPNE